MDLQTLARGTLTGGRPHLTDVHELVRRASKEEEKLCIKHAYDQGIKAKKGIEY